MKKEAIVYMGREMQIPKSISVGILRMKSKLYAKLLVFTRPEYERDCSGDGKGG